MKYISTILALFAAASVFAQENPEPTGTPALLVTANGKQARVNLESMADGNLTFAAGSRSMTVPSDKIASLKFSMTKPEFDFFREEGIISDEEIAGIYNREDLDRAQKLEEIFKTCLGNIEKLYNAADYAATIAAVEPLMKDRGQFMAIENNLDDYYIMLMESYRSAGDLAQAKARATVLLQSEDNEKVVLAKACLALIAIATDDFATAESLAAELDSEAAKLYLQACLLRAKDEPKAAFETVTTIIAEHGNDMEWLPRTELMSAYLYLDMAGTNSVITTNSAVTTARQVKNMYAGSKVAGDSKKLWASLGGEALEAKEKAAKAAVAAAKAKQAAEAKARREAEREAKRLAKAKAEAEAAAAAKAATETNTTTAVESE